MQIQHVGYGIHCLVSTLLIERTGQSFCLRFFPRFTQFALCFTVKQKPEYMLVKHHQLRFPQM